MKGEAAACLVRRAAQAEKRRRDKEDRETALRDAADAAAGNGVALWVVREDPCQKNHVNVRILSLEPEVAPEVSRMLGILASGILTNFGRCGPCRPTGSDEEPLATGRDLEAGDMPSALRLLLRLRLHPSTPLFLDTHQMSSEQGYGMSLQVQQFWQLQTSACRKGAAAPAAKPAQPPAPTAELVRPCGSLGCG